MVQVLLFHAWNVGSPIGVDAFIMISAFLMTSSFVRRSEAGAMPFFVERWATTFKRLLPPLAIVVLSTVGASLVVLPASRWREILVQAFASMTYWQNWRLVTVSADYFAGDHAAASPLQHLWWSMSMQGQVFLVWPVLLTLCVMGARALHTKVRPVAFFAFTSLTVASLLWLLGAAPTDGSAYFDTRARIWEFSLGSALAVAAPWIRVAPRYARLLSWTGLAVLLLFGLVSIGTYPGPMAAIPILATSAILLFPSEQSETGVGRILSLRPLTGLGGISYAVYLSHWPLFVIYLGATGQSRLGVWEGALLIVASVGAAWLFTRLVEDPIRTSPRINATIWTKGVTVLVSLALGTAPVGVGLVLLDRASAQQSEDQLAVEDAEHPGASVLLGEARADFTEPAVPGPLALDAEWAGFTERCEGTGGDRFDDVDHNYYCRQFGDDADAAARVLIGGDSHTFQLIVGQIEPLLEDQNWMAQSVFGAACSWGLPEAYEGRCAERNESLLGYVDEFDPDYVALMVTSAAADSPDETLRPGVRGLIEELTSRGITVLGVRDNPRSQEDLYECSSERPSDSPYGGCLLLQSQYLPSSGPAAELEGIEGFKLIDMSDAYCVDGVCPTIIGNVHVYLDNSHVGATYSATVAPYFSSRVLAALELPQ